MVSKKTIKGLDFDTIEDYFNYIIESKINGQPQQARELYNDLSTRQKNEFNNFVNASFHYEAADNNDELSLSNLLTYLNG